MLRKTCDNCKIEIKSENEKQAFSEWCLYYFKKRRDFCSNKCLFEFVKTYIEVNK